MSILLSQLALGQLALTHVIVDQAATVNVLGSTSMSMASMISITTKMISIKKNAGQSLHAMVSLNSMLSIGMKNANKNAKLKRPLLKSGKEKLKEVNNTIQVIWCALKKFIITASSLKRCALKVHK